MDSRCDSVTIPHYHGSCTVWSAHLNMLSAFTKLVFQSPLKYQWLRPQGDTWQAMDSGLGLCPTALPVPPLSFPPHPPLVCTEAGVGDLFCTAKRPSVSPQGLAGHMPPWRANSHSGHGSFPCTP